MILAHKKCYPSCKVLRNEIQKISGVKLLITDNPEVIKRKRAKIHIRYGNSAFFDVAGKDTRYNTPESIRISSNKRIFSTNARSHGILAPDFFRFYSKEPIGSDFPILIRSRLGGKSGEGILGVFENMESIPTSYLNHWWTKFYNLPWELRIHIFDGQIIKMFSKRLMEEMKYPLRFDRNCRFVLLNHNKPGKYVGLKKEVYDIYDKFLHAGFFVLDAGWSKETKSYLYLESGTAPGLNQNSAYEYAKRLVPKIF